MGQYQIKISRLRSKFIRNLEVQFPIFWFNALKSFACKPKNMRQYEATCLAFKRYLDILCCSVPRAELITKASHTIGQINLGSLKKTYADC